jgi:MtN3 and saliva related transmembrane protein
MDIIAMIGLGAAALSTVSLLPQLFRVWKTKSVKDISTGYCGVMFTSVALWLLYGVLARDVPIIAANSVVIVQSAAILAFKTRYQPGMFSGLTSMLKLHTIKDSAGKQEAEANAGIPFLL